VFRAVLGNVWQRQQQRCQEVFNKISSQEIFLHLVILYIYTGMPHNLLIVQKRFEIVLCRDWSVRHHNMFSEIYICRKFYIWLTQKIFIFGFCCQEKKINVLGLVSCTQFLNYSVESVAHMQLKLYYLLVKYLSCIILY
jgi:hypothetical protein